MEQSLSIVVLAAGAGTRMRSTLPKVLHRLCGRSALRLVLDVADALGSAQTAVVLSPAIAPLVAEEVGPSYIYVVQEQQLGTGHALAQARAALEGRSDYVLVLYGDSPLLRVETASELVSTVHESHALVGLISFEANPPTGYGRILRDEQKRVVGLVEERDATPTQRAITEANSGFMCFDASWLWQRVDEIPLSPIKGEYYLTELVGMAVADRGPGAAIALSINDVREAWGFNDRVQLADIEGALRERLVHSLMRAGVVVTDPPNTYLDVGVTVEDGTTLFPGTILAGTTQVGAGCQIGPYAELRNTTVGDGAHVRFAVVEGGNIAPGAVVGPFVYLVGNGT